MKITKEFSFDAAHRLHLVAPCHPCRNLHGHRYKVIVSLYSNELTNGMLMDYRDLSIVKKWIDDTLDHSTLVSEKDDAMLTITSKHNSVFGKVALLPIEETTAEFLSCYIALEVKNMLPKGFCGYIEVTVCETPNTSATCGPIVIGHRPGDGISD